ncbi:hypothetical protein ACFX2B_025264 [Malus domestica]
MMLPPPAKDGKDAKGEKEGKDAKDSKDGRDTKDAKGEKEERMQRMEKLIHQPKLQVHLFYQNQRLLLNQRVSNIRKPC